MEYQRLTYKTESIWLSDRDLALRYSVSRITVWRWAREGRIPQPCRLGPNTTRWNRAELDALDARMMAGQRAGAIG